MLKLSTFKQISKEIVSNPIKSMRKIAKSICSPSRLESSPAVDTLIKMNPQNYILGANPGKMIKQITANASSAFGKDASVFPIPNHSDMVLRVEHTALKKMESLAENLKLIPIKHQGNVADKKNLGLPLYSIVGKDSELYARESITPLEALRQKDNIMVLRKVTGQHPASDVFEKLMDVMGITDGSPNVPQYLNFQQLTDINMNYGKEAAKKGYEFIKKGGEQTIPKGFFGPESESYTFTNCDEFMTNYRNYVDCHKKYLKQLSKMPKEAFKEAVDTILMDKNFLVDFQHTNNTFVDFKNKKFNFMDFEYDKTNTKYIYENPVKEFRNVILGKCFAKGVRNPVNLFFEEKDLEVARKYARKISDKVNAATPDEYKFM